MGYRLLTNYQHLDRHNGCRHPARRRSIQHPLRWIGLDRPSCVFIGADLHRDGPEAIVAHTRAMCPAWPPPSGGSRGQKRPRSVAPIGLALIAAGALSGCGDGGDRIQDTRDPCEFVLDFGTRCMPAGKTAICSHRRTIIARSNAKECVPAAD